MTIADSTAFPHIHTLSVLVLPAVFMAWMKLETAVARNRKFVKAGPDAAWLWVCGLAYCQEGLTDGFIPAEALAYLGVPQAGKLATRLVLAGLWDACESGGWQVHDYLDHNKPAEEIRRINQARATGGHRGGRPLNNLDQNLEGKPSPQPKVSKELTLPPNLDLNPSVPEQRAAVPESRAAEQSGAPKGPRPLAPIHSSHKNHAACGRTCVFASQHADFVRRRNHDNADQELRDWYLRIDAEWSDGPHAADEPGECFKFWEAQYSVQWPTSAAVRPSQPAKRWAGWVPTS